MIDMTPTSTSSNHFGSPHSIGDPTESESQSIILTKVESETEQHKISECEIKSCLQFERPLSVSEPVKQNDMSPEPTIMTDVQRPRLLLQHSNGEQTYIEESGF